MSAAGLEARDLAFDRGARKILDKVALKLRRGEVLALLGANGSGKTTLLRLLMGFLTPAAGEVTLDGASLATMSRRAIAQKLAYVPQSHVAPFPYLVRDVVALGRLPHQGWFGGGDQAEALAGKTLARLGIAHLAERPYTELSGGERQLALLARALAQGGDYLVLDEPMAGLDYGAQMRLMRLLRDLAGEGRGVIMSTHHPEHAHWACDRAAILRQGRILAAGAPAEILDAAAIAELYGVAVESFDGPAGRRVFVPKF